MKRCTSEDDSRVSEMNAGEVMGLFFEDVGHRKNTSASHLLSVRRLWEIRGMVSREHLDV